MNRYAIQDKAILQWDGTQDSDKIKSALECARTNGTMGTVDSEWRWIAYDLTELYLSNPDEAAACFSWINGWITGASAMLFRAVFAGLDN